EYVVHALGLARSALRLADDLGFEALGEPRTRQRLPLDAPRERAHRVARWRFERREIDLSLDELRGHGDRQAPARGVTIGGGLLGLPWLADHGRFALRHTAQEALDVVRPHAALGEFARCLDERVEVMAAGIELVRRLRQVP